MWKGDRDQPDWTQPFQYLPARHPKKPTSSRWIDEGWLADVRKTPADSIMEAVNKAWADKKIAPLVDPKAALLDGAKVAVCRDRNADYGNPADNFGRTVDLINAVLKDKLKAPITSAEFALMMIQVKVARLMHEPMKTDSWTDIAGYAACGSEVAQ